MEELERDLCRRIRKQLMADFTVGRTDNDLPEVDGGRIRYFLDTHAEDILRLARILLSREPDEDIQDDWIRELLYEESWVVDALVSL
ncbi:MAG: hypothetical protein ACYCOU_07890 [Sulfobacillus sp.]